MRSFTSLPLLFCIACAADTAPTVSPSETVYEDADPEEEDDDACAVDTSYDPLIDPARFVDVIDNPLFPLVPGTQFVYVKGDERIEVTVTHERKNILGVSTTVVHDVETEGGELIEDTFDWYAQDVDGAVWYFGEDTRAYEDGMVSTEGSWEAGVDGAKPGIIIPAHPEVGMTYRQEYYACEAEDMGEVLSVCARVGEREDCLQTLDTTPLEPDAREHKFYCPGVGLVLAVDLETGEQEVLQP